MYFFVINHSQSPSSTTGPATRRRAVCRYFRNGRCNRGVNCNFIHPAQEVPDDTIEAQASTPSTEPSIDSIRDLTAISREMTCGICMEPVFVDDSTSPNRSARKFGLLENCNHCFCVSCIKRWRDTDGYEQGTRRQCPICRTPFHLITPSKYWIESAAEKANVIDRYRRNLKTKPCRAFDNGLGVCPSGHDCFFSHALPDGTEVGSGAGMRSVFGQEGLVVEISHTPSMLPESQSLVTVSVSPDDLPTAMMRVPRNRISEEVSNHLLRGPLLSGAIARSYEGSSLEVIATIRNGHASNGL